MAISVKKKPPPFPLLLAKAINRCYNKKVNELSPCAATALRAAWEDTDIMKMMKIVLLVIVLLAIALLVPSPALI